MNYEKIYKQIVERAKNRVLDCYTEKHHIIPRCMGGSDEKDNLVRLTAREHFICHKLLVQIYPNNKLKFALWSMCRRANKQNRYVPSSREYESIKLLWVDLNSKRIRTQEERNKMSESRKGIVFSDETKLKMSKARSSQKDSPERIKKRAESISKVKKGIPLTDSHKQALKKPKNKIKNCLTCRICGVYTTKTVISRNHGKDKCKK